MFDATKDDSYPSVKRRIRIFLSYALRKWNPHPTIILSKGLGGDASPPLPVLSLNLVSQIDKGWSRVLKKLGKCAGIRTDPLLGIRQTGYEEWKKVVSFPHQPKSVPLHCASWPLTSEPTPSSFHPDGLHLLSSAAKCRYLLMRHQRGTFCRFL